MNEVMKKVLQYFASQEKLGISPLNTPEIVDGTMLRRDLVKKAIYACYQRGYINMMKRKPCAHYKITQQGLDELLIEELKNGKM